MSWSEVFVSIEQGIADGLQLQPQAISGFGFDKMIRYGTFTDTLMTVHVAQINADTWDGLSPELQDIVTQASAEALEIANSKDRADIDRIVEDLSGTIQFYRPNDQEFETWRSAAMGIWDEFTGSMDPDVLARVQAAQE